MNTEITGPPPYNEKAAPYIYQSPPPIMNPTLEQPGFHRTIMGPLSEHPMQCVCSRCGALIVTRTEKEAGIVTWLLCGGLIIIGCWLCCCFIPFCIDGVKDTAHYCPNCANLVGVKHLI
ncbi:unnamed protein product [Rotaria magnacalcarata]|uniref:LITAF domain-containing protein n=1 Tax=Rotaria magnacalcarata TaxID=392030 RepID=A0A816B0A2_9BILA|nr:unnamed protein product [Rotaria magnacalcarata]CAF1601491.1 unnamed protein product [Rotaria magnacalcarata]CAF3834066.1 unnamed protein product [Rotaria magnacalcarata]CAF3847610.1 unnamed protein product [Rotaria magnacalcarata]